MMDLYTATAYDTSRQLTKAFSTSFSQSSKLFPKRMRAAIYAIYGMVRVADEIVDTYRGEDAPEVLTALEQETYLAIERGYSTNPLLHAFAHTARTYAIDESLIAPFFASMRHDLTPPAQLSQAAFETYIHGSAEVVGLMCLKVFCKDDAERYAELEPGAKALGSAYQKVNFLRDIGEDWAVLGRMYFPGLSTLDELTEAKKHAIIADIEQDFALADAAINQLPPEAKKAVRLSYRYYKQLLAKIQHTPAEALHTTRVRLPDYKKLFLLAQVRLGI